MKTTTINNTTYYTPNMWSKRSRIFKDTWREGKEYQNASGNMRVYKTKDGKAYLYSYNTLVIEVFPDGWGRCFGTYSTTTRRHISQFFRDFFPKLNYYAAKESAETGIIFNTATGQY